MQAQAAAKQARAGARPGTGGPRRRAATGARTGAQRPGGQQPSSPPRHRRRSRTAPRPRRRPRRARSPPRRPSGGSFLDTLMGLWWVLGPGGTRRCIAFFGMRLLQRAPRRSSEFDDSLGRLAAAGADAAELGSMSATRSFSDPDPEPSPPRAGRASRTSAPPLPERLPGRGDRLARAPAPVGDRHRAGDGRAQARRER